MMRTVILSAFLAAIPLFCYGGQDPPTRPEKKQPGQQAVPVVQSPKATIPALPAEPSKPGEEGARQSAEGKQGEEEAKGGSKPTGSETDPLKMAAPPHVEGVRPPGSAPADEKTYIIGAEDVLFVEVWGNAALSRQALVRSDGKISVGLIGEVAAAEKTPEALAREIADKLREGGYLKNPQVGVTVQQINSKKYCINGEVNKTGCFPLIVPTRVFTALVNAGGFRDFANKKDIQINRGTKRFKFNYNQVIEGKKLEQNIFLEPGDIIIVK